MPINASGNFLADYKKPDITRIADLCNRAEHKAKELKKYY